MPRNLPTPTPGAAEIAKVGGAVIAAVAGAVFPAAALPASLLAIGYGFAIDRFVERSTRILEDALKDGDVSVDRDQTIEALVPMAFRFFEAAKQGEYVHNLKLLGAYIASELGEENPDPGHVCSAARNIEGLSAEDLRVAAMIKMLWAEAEEKGEDFGFVSAARVYHAQFGKLSELAQPLSQRAIQSCLSTLMSRGLLIPDGATRASKAEEYYYTTDALHDLFKKAALAFGNTA